VKAVIYRDYGPPEVLKIDEVARPVPRDNEVLIKIYSASVTAIDRGYQRTLGRNNSEKPRRHMLGHYLAGEVEETGKEVKRFKKGDRVYGGDVWSVGTYAEYKCMSEKGVLVKIPPNLSYEEAATITYGGLTALPFLRDAGKIKKGHKVLIIGASGSIGAYAAQLARYYGAEVTGVCSTGKIDLVKSLGVTHVINYTRDDFTKNGQTYDIIFDTPAKSSFARCKNSLTGHGRYLTTVPWPGEILQMLWTSVAGHKKGLFRPMGLRSTRKKTKDLIFLNELFSTGKIKPVIDRCYPLEQVVDAYRYVEKGHKKGNVVITMNTTNINRYPLASSWHFVT
jgi:NADPH:quinone reductase-like Zn-dependent oxidoreductase